MYVYLSVWFARKGREDADAKHLDWQCRVCAFHDGYRARERRSQHGRCAVLCLLCRAAARGCGARETIWHGCLGAELHVALGSCDGHACVGEEEVAALSA